MCGIDQGSDQRTHNPQDGGSNPPPATQKFDNYATEQFMPNER